MDYPNVDGEGISPRRLLLEKLIPGPQAGDEENNALKAMGGEAAMPLL
ncbi:MAG: hypothetical protein GY772_12405 [bacterium]|nr:hypothetical protein [bacterium]